jgi:hypothetical protein
MRPKHVLCWRSSGARNQISPTRSGYGLLLHPHRPFHLATIPISLFSSPFLAGQYLGRASDDRRLMKSDGCRLHVESAAVLHRDRGCARTVNTQLV